MAGVRREGRPWLRPDPQGKNLLQAYPELVERKLERFYHDALKGEVRLLSHSFHRFLLLMRSPIEGSDFMLQTAQISPLKSDDGVIGTVTVIQDVTERVVSEAKVRQREREFQSLTHLIPHLVWMANADGSVFWYNESLYEYTGTDKDTERHALPAPFETWHELICKGTEFDTVLPLKSKNGTSRPFLIRFSPVTDAKWKLLTGE